MIGRNIVPCQLHLVQTADLPHALTGLKPDLRAFGFKVTAGAAGSVSVTMKAPDEAAAVTHVLPVVALGEEWFGEFLSIAAFVNVTGIMVYLTDQFRT